MRFIPVAVSLSLLILASAYPTKNLKNDLRNDVKDAVTLMYEDKIWEILSYVKMMENSNLIDPTKKEELKNFDEKWSSGIESYLHNSTLLDEFHNQISNILSEGPFLQVGSLHESVDLLDSRIYKHYEDAYAAFETKSAEKIRVAKEDGYTDESLNNLFDIFTKADNLYDRRSTFTNFGDYLGLTK